MKFTDLPLDILVIILVDVKDLKYLLNYNKNLNFTIEYMFERYNKKFNNLLNNWQFNINQLFDILIASNDIDSIKFLLNNYYNQIDYLYIISKSSQFNNFNIISLLNLDSEAQYHKVATLSARNGNLDFVKWAYSKITETREKVKTILHIADNAARNKHKEIINWALDHGADYDFVALGAAKGGHFDLVLECHLKSDIELNWIAYAANKYRHYNISNWAIEMGANNFILIARGFTANQV